MQQKISLQILKVKPFAKKQKWQLCLSEVSLMIFLWWKLHPEVIGVRFGGGKGADPLFEKCQGQFCFQDKRKLLKNPEPGKKFQYNVFSVYSFGADPCNLGYCSV